MYFCESECDSLKQTSIIYSQKSKESVCSYAKKNYESTFNFQSIYEIQITNPNFHEVGIPYFARFFV